MGIILTLLAAAVGLIGSLLLLRAWLWSLAISPRDPLVRFAWTLTDWLVNPVAWLVKPRGNWDLSSLAAALLLAVVYTLFLRESVGVPVSAMAFFCMPLALLLRWAIDLLVWGVIIYCVLSFTSLRSSGLAALLGTLIDPFLRPIRRVLPRFRGLDLSPVVLFFALNIILSFVAPLSAGAMVF